MDMTWGLMVVAGLLAIFLVPFLIWEIRSGKRRGSWLLWWKPRGHGDIGPDLGQTVPSRRTRA